MFDDLPPLSHEEQQKAVEKIQELMAEGIGTAQAIKMVAEEIRAEAAKQQQKQTQLSNKYTEEQGTALFLYLYILMHYNGISYQQAYSSVLAYRP